MLANAFSIDVEDYFQVSGFESRVARGDWDNRPSRVVKNTRRLLEMLEKHRVTATFFVLGWVAEKFPELVADIDAGGHEIGTHSYWHHLIYDQTPDEFRDDLRRSRDVLENITGRPVIAFRAPSFSITRRSMWALEIMAEEGIQFDSSIFPIRHDRYGIPGARCEIHPIKTAAGTVWEFPMSVARLSGISLPASGGGYFRLYPYRLTERLITSINRAGRPVMFYVHPWELDPSQPDVRGVSWLARRRHRINLRSTETKLERLLSDFRFDSMANVMRSQQIGPEFDAEAQMPSTAK